MKNLIEYLKGKIYYVMAVTILIIILLIIMSACSNRRPNTYEKIESSMVSAAKTYYSSRKNKLPKEDRGIVNVTIGTLQEAELLDEVIDPKNKSQTCEGYVQVKKIDNDYSYIPFLTCKGNYEPKFLVDIIKNSKLDEYGNGVYEMDGEYVYRGDDVKNYITFNDQLWRIIKVDKDGDIKLITNEPTEKEYSWDTSYNAEIEQNEESGFGNTTDYFYSDLHKSLVNYYKENFNNDVKKYMKEKTYCIGKKSRNDMSLQNECLSQTKKQYIGLINVSDYINASLDSKCFGFSSKECQNRNYLNSSVYLNSWLFMTVSDNTYQSYVMSKTLSYLVASEKYTINPVIHLSSDVVIINGDGEEKNPYQIK